MIFTTTATSYAPSVLLCMFRSSISFLFCGQLPYNNSDGAFPMSKKRGSITSCAPGNYYYVLTNFELWIK